MSRSVALNLLASALTIFAAITLLGSAAFVTDGPGAVPAEPHVRAVIERFYAAVNEVLRTGDSSALAAAVAADFLIHTSPPGLPPDRHGLEKYLTTIRMVAPRVQLRVEDLVVAADHGMARVAVRSDGPGTFLGLQFAASPPLWGPFDAFRIADGRVSEWWSSAAGAILFEPLEQAALDQWPSGPDALSLERLIGPAGEDWSVGPLIEPRVIYVIAGMLTVALDDENRSEPPTAVMRGPTVTLQAGETLSLPAGARYTLSGKSSQPEPLAAVVGFPRFSYTGPLPPAEADPGDAAARFRPGAQAQLIPVVLEAPIEFPQSAASVSFGRLILPAGGAISLRELAGPLILSIEEGTLTWAADPRAKAGRQGANGMSTGAASGTLDVGEGVTIPMGASLELRAIGTVPTTVMVVTILPDRLLPSAGS